MVENQITVEKTFQVSEVQLTYRPSFKPSERPKITSSNDGLNRANRVLGIFLVSQGGVAGTVADPKVIFAAALKAFASSIILAHNHPSGNLNPSQADIDLTRKIKTGGQIVDIGVYDHIILTAEGFYSFSDKGMM